MSVRNLALPWGSAVPDADADRRASDAAEQQRAAPYPTPERIDVETIYRTRRPEMIRYLVSFGVEVMEAEDITHEVFLQLSDPAKQQIRAQNAFRWVLTCAKNLAISRYRRSRREVLVPGSLWKEWEETLPDGAATADVCVHEKEDRLRLARAIGQLSALEQQCLVLRSRGVSFREISSTLNLSMQSAVYTTDVAIQKLQRKLKGARS